MAWTDRGVMVIETLPQSGEVLSSPFDDPHIAVKATVTVHGSLSGSLRENNGEPPCIEIACIDGRVCLFLSAGVKILFPSLMSFSHR